MKIYRSALLVCCLVALSTGLAAAQDDSPVPLGKWWKSGRIAALLKLTPDQQARIEALWVENRRSLIDKKAELDKRNLDLSEILSRNIPDESTVLAAYDRVLAARSEMERTMFLMRLRIKNVLNLEQQRAIEEISPRVQNAIRGRRMGPARQAPPTP
jgi:Spy/CpxP family protein refolding chaperone